MCSSVDTQQDNTPSEHAKCFGTNQACEALSELCSLSCRLSVWLQVLESFKIMDYSLLLGIHVLDRKPLSRGSRCDSKKGQKVLYSTALESIQGNLKDPEPVTDDDTYVTVSHMTSKNHHPPYWPFAFCHSSLLDSFYKKSFWIPKQNLNFAQLKHSNHTTFILSQTWWNSCQTPRWESAHLSWDHWYPSVLQVNMISFLLLWSFILSLQTTIRNKVEEQCLILLD